MSVNSLFSRGYYVHEPLLNKMVFSTAWRCQWAIILTKSNVRKSEPDYIPLLSFNGFIKHYYFREGIFQASYPFWYPFIQNTLWSSPVPSMLNGVNASVLWRLRLLKIDSFSYTQERKLQCRKELFCYLHLMPYTKVMKQVSAFVYLCVSMK